MKTIGLVGGMSWESSALYYRLINEAVRERLGGHNSAQLVLYSVNFAEIEDMQRRGDWDAAATALCHAAQCLEHAGADFFLLCTNTMHLVADSIAAAVQIPLLHIADATGQALAKEGVRHVALLGTRFTMEMDFYKKRLVDDFGITVTVPTADDRSTVDHIIYQELCMGKITPDSRRTYVDIINKLISQGAEAVVLGCTEIGLLISQGDVPVPVFDTTRIHAAAAVEKALC
jgi:aspartate racemase